MAAAAETIGSGFQMGVKLTYMAGDYPYFVNSADFNGDYNVDLAVANRGSHNVSILLGNGNGSFQSAVNYDTGFQPVSVMSADFDGDNTLDLAVANYESGNISILLGNGDGTFQAGANYGVGTHPFSVTSADFNGDDKVDLAVTNLESGNVSVLLGNGDGTFQAAVNYGGLQRPFAITSVDFNGDDKVDLAVTNNESGNISILLGNGDGTFQPAVNYAVGTFPVSFTSADFNGDGNLDLAVAHYPHTVSILLGNGDGTFQPAVGYATAWPWSITHADFNGDDNLDLAVAGSDTSSVSVMLGNWDGTFQAPIYFDVGWTHPSSVSSADFDTDGKPDLAVARSYSTQDNGSVAVLLNSTPSDYFPVSPGTTWRYLVNGKSYSNTRILQERKKVQGINTAVFLDVKSGSKEFYTSDPSGIRLHGMFQPSALIEELGYVDMTLTFIPPLVIAPGSMEIGQTFDSSGVVQVRIPEYGVGDSIPYDAIFTFEDIDRITVPAGDFSVLWITGTVTVGGESELHSLYLAREVGTIKHIVTAGGRTETMELVSMTSLTLLAPNGGEVIHSGGTYDIKWESTPDMTTFRLTYSLDNGVTWTRIPGAENLTENHYLWTVPTPAGNKRNCRMKVKGYNAANINVKTDTSDAPFTIEVAKIVQPNGGETLSSGSSYPIQWEINGTKSPVTKVNLYYTTDGGVSYVLISNLAGSDRSYNWTVPTPLSNKKNTRIRVVAYSGSTIVGSDSSDNPFTIEVVKIVQPNGGETLLSGSSYPIQWEINGTKSPVTKVNLYYTTNKGVSYRLISSISTVDPVTRPWAMSHPWAPTVISKKPYCKVKVVLYNTKNIILSSDVSDRYFTISP
jgi:hypothetical protein